MRPAITAASISFLGGGDARATVTLDLHAEDITSVLDACDTSQVGEGALALLREVAAAADKARRARIAAEVLELELAPPALGLAPPVLELAPPAPVVVAPPPVVTAPVAAPEPSPPAGAPIASSVTALASPPPPPAQVVVVTAPAAAGTAAQ